jgi:hypothetical protein
MTWTTESKQSELRPIVAAQELPSRQNNAATPSSISQFNNPLGTLGSAVPAFELATDLHVQLAFPDPVRPRFTVPQAVVVLATAQVRDRNL